MTDAGDDGSAAGGGSPLEGVRGLVRALAELSCADLSGVQYLQRVSGELVDRVGVHRVDWDLRVGESTVRAQLERGPAGAEWSLCPAPLPAADDAGAVALPLDAAERLGSLRLERRDRPFSAEERALLEIAAGSIAVALAGRSTRASLRERVKELGCLFAVARIAERIEDPFDEVLRRIAAVLPAAWLYPEHAVARITLDGVTHDSRAEWTEISRLEAEIAVRGERRGAVQVSYVVPRPQMYEGPFLREERRLLDAVAHELAGIIERREAREQRASLEEQIRHADRLATIGQLAAGVAHELNEPLGAILGFAELLAGQDGLDAAGRADVGKIVAASLRARDIVNKLRLFARQSPPQRGPVSLNAVIEEGLYFTEAQCARHGIAIARDLDPDLPEIEADPAQMHQVLTNLTVNAMQAMPAGGRMTIRTRARELEVALFVEDTGIGMSADVLRRIFVPFFTTKTADQGTGLGLSVVHGIVAAHGGAIEVRSAPGAGAVFEVRLPRPGAGAVARAT